MFKEMRSFDGVIEFNGGTVNVEFSSAGLFLKNLSSEAAFAILEQITGKKTSFTIPTVTTPFVQTGTFSPTVTLTTTNDTIVYVTDHQDPPQPMAPPKKREPVKVEVTVADPTPVEIPVVNLAAPVETTADDLYDPTMNNVGTLKELIILLADKGLRTEEQVMNAIEQLKDKVDLLKVTKTNLESRVSRILTTLDLGA